MEDEKVLTVDDVYNLLISKMSAEEALKKLIGYQVEQYESLKNMQVPEGPVNPIFIIACAAADIGWDLALEKGDPDANIEGMAVGTDAYLNRLLNGESEKRSNDGPNPDGHQVEGDLPAAGEYGD